MATVTIAIKKTVLNIYLLKKSGVAPNSSLLSEAELLNKVERKPGKFSPINCDRYLLGNAGDLGILFIRKPLSESVPEWVDLVAASLPPKAVDKLKSKSVSALLVKTVNNRQFAIAFGHGRHMLDPNIVEHRFGIKVALNSIEPNSIASIDRQTFDATPKLSRTQTVKPSAMADYGINTEQDLLRGVVGNVKSQFSGDLGTTIAGMDSFKTALAISLHEIDSVLTTALSRSVSKDYLAAGSGRTSAFAWVDNLQAISDPTEIDELDQALWSAFEKGEFDKMWLAIPEIINWEEVAGFAYTKRQVEDGDLVLALDIAAMKATFTSGSTLKTLRSRFIHMVLAVDGITKMFSAYKCLYAEIKAKLGSSLHILNAGNWYKVEPSFEKSVCDHFANLPRMAFTAPFVLFDHKDEDAYNKAVCASNTSAYKLLDRKLIQFGGGHSSIELCDLYSPRKSASEPGQLIHVKHGRGSAPLSHLFAQGLVSSTLLVMEPKFVTQVNLQLVRQGGVALPSKIVAADYDLIYAIIDGDASKPLDLPFFSKVTLHNSARSIKALGFEVRLLHIPETPAYIASYKAAAAAKRATKQRAVKSAKSAVAKSVKPAGQRAAKAVAKKSASSGP